jgi:MSHA pilin protein MshD
MCIASMRKKRVDELGVSFIELILFIVIVSIAVAGVLLVMNNTTRYSGDPQMRKQALAIAESLLEEVELARFTYCNPADPQAPFATKASGPGAMGPQPVGSSTATGYCTTAAMVENFGAVGGTRPYGNVINYVTAFNTATVLNPIKDENGNTVGPASGYNATIVIQQPGSTLGGAMSVDPGANAAIGSVLWITVTVNYPEGAIVLDGYRTQYAPQLMP